MLNYADQNINKDKTGDESDLESNSSTAVNGNC